MARQSAAKANKLSICERSAGVTVPLWVEAYLSAVELSVGSGSGSFRAASVEVAFLAEHLCFANLTFSFLEVLILARRSNKEPSQPTAACRLSEFWMVAMLSVSSWRCAGCGTAICCARLLLSLLRPIARLQIKYHSEPLPGPKLRATEQHAGEGSWGGPKKRP